MNICVITFAPEYSGSMHLYHNAELGAKNFMACIQKYLSRIKLEINVEYKNIHGPECNARTICQHLSNVDPKYDKLIVYYSGHGDQRCGKEFWQTASGNVDQIRMAEILNGIKPPVILFSDCCDSCHNVNQQVIHHPYVSFGATKEMQDAMMMYGGGLFTSTLIDILNGIDHQITLFDIFNRLLKVGVEIQTFSFRYSSEDLANSYFI